MNEVIECVEQSTQETNLRGDEPNSSVIKRRKFSHSARIEKSFSPQQVESVLDIERRKLKVIEELAKLKRIKLMAMLKDMESRNIDIYDEINDLNEMYK